ncbi:MAG: DtxR family transcriptional regulator [Desulfobacterales bacterium]|nr:MAG: DtxR family transcriptional regulator [Desulfobacterales bacterium]
MTTPVLSASMEDYLEAIFHIITKKQAARAKDIALRLKVNNSSVTGALRTLSEKGFINYAPYDLITLTSKGKTHARNVIRRHNALRDFFLKILLIPEEEAEETACRMEHSLPMNILERLIHFIHFVESCPKVGDDWLKSFVTYCSSGEKIGNCDTCLSECMEKIQAEDAALRKNNELKSE